MTLLNRFPFFPLYYKGSTLFRPINVSDLVEIIYQVVVQNFKSITIECVGPEEISLKNILQRLLKLIGKKKLLIPMPLSIAKLSANFFQLFPKPLLTVDQLRLLKYENIPSGKYKTNFDLEIPSHANFDTEVEKYCYMWREAGQFSQIKRKNNANKPTFYN
jgi:NADH dehydrogenase